MAFPKCLQMFPNKKQMSAIIDLLIGKKLTPEEQVKKWRSQVRGYSCRDYNF